MKSRVTTTPRTTIIAKVLACLSTLLAIAVTISLIDSQLLPVRYNFVAVAVLSPLSICTLVLSFRKYQRRRTILLGICSALILIFISGVGLKLVADSRTLLYNITNDSSGVKQTIGATKPFNLYISGIDAYGDINTVSRSDVNIIASVNPQTKQILLTTVPRDTYVRIAGGGKNEYDKLTHAGIYGVSSSMQTLAQLMETELSTYARINFTSLISIVDKIGGIEVANPVTFKTDSGQVFTKGTLHLNGKDALTFSRERHNLEGGDNDRGMNQQRVIAAIITKLSSPQILKYYQSALMVLGDAVQTNLSQQSISSLINRQLDEQGEWKITMSQIAGKGQTGGLSSYAMPASQLYMFVLDDGSLQQAKSRIQSVISTK
jgi:LCP family protein required for cell wall assembly